MSRFIPIVCYDCGEYLDDIYDCYREMRNILRKESGSNIHPEKTMFVTKPAYYEAIIFESLNVGIEKDCCRTRLMTSILPSELES